MFIYSKYISQQMLKPKGKIALATSEATLMLPQNHKLITVFGESTNL